jgi:hypothetical protein
MNPKIVCSQTAGLGVLPLTPFYDFFRGIANRDEKI